MDLDLLKYLFRRQRYLQEKFHKLENYPKGMTEKEKEETFIKTLMFIFRETSEILDETNFKSHIKEHKSLDKEKILEEMIDLFKYWVNLCIIFEYSEDEVFDMFNKKSEIVEKKLLGEANVYR